MSFKRRSKYNIRNCFKLLKLTLIIFICFCFVKGEQIQDPSEVKYVNPKYLRDTQVVMFRRRKSDPYKTNITMTTYHAWGNNVTFRITYPMKGGKFFNISFKPCASMDKLWIVELIGQKTNITDCPSPAGTIRCYNLEAAPKIFPAPVPTTPKGTTSRVRVECFMTDTNEKMLEFLLRVRFK